MQCFYKCVSYSSKWQPYFVTQHYHRLVFLRETDHVFCESRTESVHKKCSNFSLQSFNIRMCVKFASWLVWTRNFTLLWKSEFLYNTHKVSLLDTIVNHLRPINTQMFSKNKFNIILYALMCHIFSVRSQLRQCTYRVFWHIWSVKMEASSSLETSVNIYKIHKAWCRTRFESSRW